MTLTSDRILCFDTETTGLPNRPKKFNTYFSPDQTYKYDSSRVVQIAWQLFTADGVAVAAPVMYHFHPDGWVISAENQEIHGISNEICIKNGKRFSDIGAEFAAALKRANIVVGHNVIFDIHIMAAEFYRYGQSQVAAELMAKKRGCTMELGKTLTISGNKNPKLADLYKHLFGCEFENAHTALADMNATAMIWFKIAGVPAVSVVAAVTDVCDITDIVKIKLSNLFVSERNVRKELEDFDETSVADLAANIQSHGLLHPLTVRERPDGRFEIIAGQRRFLALSSMHREEAPCRVVTLGDLQAEEISLTENTQRAQLSSGDKARTYSRLYEITGRDIAKLSKAVSVTQATLKKYIKIAELPAEIMAQLDIKGDGHITIDTAVALTKIPVAHQVAAAAAVSKLASSNERLEATKRIVVETAAGKVIDTTRMDAIVEHINAERLEAKRILAPTVPWIPDRSGKPMVIPEALYTAILDMIEAS